MTRETDPTPKAVVVPVEAIVRDIAEQLAASIAGLGFPVGMGTAPPEEMCLRAARGIVALYGRNLAAPQASLPPVEGVGKNAILELQEQIERTDCNLGTVTIQRWAARQLLAALSPVPSGGGEPTVDWSHGSVYDRLLTFLHDRDHALRGDDRTDPHEIDEAVLAIMKIAVQSGGGEPVAWRVEYRMPNGLVSGVKLFGCIASAEIAKSETSMATTITPLYAAPVPAVEAGWKSMESAPRDGTWIQAWRDPPKMTGPRWEPLIYVRWDDEREAWVWPDEDYEVFTERGRELADFKIADYEHYEDATGFTHWMPLPSAPGEPLPDEGLRAALEKLERSIREDVKRSPDAQITLGTLEAADEARAVLGEA